MCNVAHPWFIRLTWFHTVAKNRQDSVSRDVVFDESASWYLPPTPDLDSNLSSDDEVSEAEMPPDEPEIGTEWTTESVPPVRSRADEYVGRSEEQGQVGRRIRI